MKIVKIIILQIFWYVSISYGDHLLIPLVGVGLYFLDFFIFKKQESLRTRYLFFSLVLILSGFGMDKFFEAFEVLTWGDRFYPTELIGVWVIFPCYYYQFFKKFSSPIWPSFLMGAIFGPLAYFSGANINPKLILDFSPTGLGLVSLFWGLFFLLSIFFHSRGEG